MRYVLGNSLDSVDDGRLRLAEFIAPLDISSRQTNRIEVVFEELISNIVRYGIVGNGQGRIVVDVTADADTITLIAQDNGIAFNPLEKAAPAPFDTIENAKIGGLGIPLMRKFTKSLDYEYTGSAEEFIRLTGVPADAGLNRVTAVFSRS